MIVGTAGHIDHGKTTLVRALTGVDTDRLPEEKKRGISIELGYAFLDVPSSFTRSRSASSSATGESDRATIERIGFIDVPGHERLVHTMLAGATGIDFALLLVAADDGVMPQTREHLAVLSLLGIAQGAVAITKIDRVDAARLDEVRREIAVLLAPTPLAGATIVEVSAQTGQGVSALRDLLFEAASRMRSRSGNGSDSAFRMAIDRSFTLSGVGTVVTGTVHAGVVNVGDEVSVTPSTNGVAARVRSVHAQNASAARALTGQRCAVALVGVARDEVVRGQWLVAAGSEIRTDRFDATLTLWHDETKPLRSGTRVHVHVGAGDTLGSVAVLGGMADVDMPDKWSHDIADGAKLPDTLLPGSSGYVQIVLQEPIAAWYGDRLVIRDASSTRTIAGGVVLDPFAPARYRRTRQRLTELDSRTFASAADRLGALIGVSPFGVSLDRWRLAEGLLPKFNAALPQDILSISHKEQGRLVLGRDHVDRIEAEAVAALAAFHVREPEALGPTAGRLRRLVAPRLSEALWQALLSRLQSSGRVILRGTFVHLPEHGISLSASDQRIAQKIAPYFITAGFEGCWARDLARDAGESEALMRTTLGRLAQDGKLHQVVKDLYFTAHVIERLALIVRQLEGKDGQEGVAAGITAAAFRDATNLGRKRAIQLLEYFDRIGLLRRVGDVHRLRPETSLLVPDAPSALNTADSS